MASIAPNHSIATGTAPVGASQTELVARLFEQAARLRLAQITVGIGLFRCQECLGEWVAGEDERHVSGCTVGEMLGTLKEILDPTGAIRAEMEPHERSSAGSDQAAGVAGGDRSRDAFEYGEPWEPTADYDPRDSHVWIRDVSSGWVLGGYARQARRALACVNFCAGISDSLLARLIPLREIGIGAAGKGADALLGDKGGAR